MISQELSQLSTPMVCFWNPGHLDLSLLSVFGASVKPGVDRPIGRFGSGLKHAIAGIYRLGGKVRIRTAGTEYEIRKLDVDFRGKAFSQLALYDEDQCLLLLPFTTDLGSHWSPWMIYREFFSNALDEGGGIGEAEHHGCTEIIIEDCPVLEEIHRQRDLNFISDENDVTDVFTEEVQSFTRNDPSEVLFYRGIRASNPEGGRKWLFSWSIESEIPLSEDRLFSSLYTAKSLIADALLSGGNDETWQNLVDTTEFSPLELELDFSKSKAVPNEIFKSFWLKQLTGKKSVPYYIRELLKKIAAAEVEKIETPDPAIMPMAEMEAAAPEVGKKPYMWSVISEMNDHVEQLQSQVAYWKAIVRKLTPEAAVATPEVAEAVPHD